ncbi:hypothetical protein BDQ17DRAFT_304865 [Cyathus striatus]|nr:hypothetical protein BDQ17DRAFT_304865 [Cyathus striatus]
MDSHLNFDGYTSYSESSTPRTPSPRTDDLHYRTHSPHFKPNLDHEPVRNIFDHHDDGAIPVDATYWPPPPQSAPHAFAFNTTTNSSRGSLLEELYNTNDIDHQPQQTQQEVYPVEHHESSYNAPENWSHVQGPTRPHDYQIMRRATFPYVKQDRGDGVPIQQYPPFAQNQQHQQHYASQQEGLYGDLTAEPGPIAGEYQMPSLTSSPHSSYREFDDPSNIKLEDTGNPMMVPSQAPFYRPPSSSGCHPMGMPSYMGHHAGLPIQHTDDAASKETQYLRRRCFNCHTTEPPSWRRSTLNPGKIVCNKCGLYERTHLRPRPLRFDELRAGGKARKQSKGTVSPKAKTISTAAAAGNGGSPMIKKEPREYGLVRRSSVSSASSVHSGSGASDWDDSGVLRKAAPPLVKEERAC